MKYDFKIDFNDVIILFILIYLLFLAICGFNTSKRVDNLEKPDSSYVRINSDVSDNIIDDRFNTNISNLKTGLIIDEKTKIVYLCVTSMHGTYYGSMGLTPLLDENGNAIHENELDY